MKDRESRSAEYDAADTLAPFREKFALDEHVNYFNSNSLGLPARGSLEAIHRISEEWTERGVRGWIGGSNEWFTLAEDLNVQIAPLLGARTSEVSIQLAATVNFHILLRLLYKPTKERFKIAIEENAFSSDRYAVEGVLRENGYSLEEALVIIPADILFTPLENIYGILSENISILILQSVQYLSGQLMPMETITKKAQEKGIIVGFNLCHSIGVVPHFLHDHGIDFAVYCTYKYLCAGPGAMGGLFLHEKHHHMIPENNFTGWWGSDKTKQFSFEEKFIPATSASALQVSTASIFSMAPLIGVLPLFTEAGLSKVYEKVQRQTEYALGMMRERLSDHNLTIVTPPMHGAHIACQHPSAAAIVEALTDRGIIVDYREPSLIRFAFHPLYTRYADIDLIVLALENILETKEYKKFTNVRKIVS